jgi:hypothetical protein
MFLVVPHPAHENGTYLVVSCLSRLNQSQASKCTWHKIDGSRCTKTAEASMSACPAQLRAVCSPIAVLVSLRIDYLVGLIAGRRTYPCVGEEPLNCRNRMGSSRR